MPDSDVPDYRTPSRDDGHEAIRAPLAQAIDDLAAAVAAGNQNAAGVDDSYFLTDLLFSLLDSALAAIDQQTADIADLKARVAVLEPAVPTP